MTLDQLNKQDIEKLKWYYTVELKPGAYTQGRIASNLAMITDFIDNIIYYDNLSCLDIGTQEGVLPVHLFRKKVASIVAYDRLDLTDRINLVKEAYKVDFKYACGLHLHELSKWNS